MTGRAYDHPLYYDIAFARFRRVPREVDFFEAAIARHSRVRVRSMLQVACGGAAHLEEIARRGYRFVGLDLNPEMLRFCREKADRLHAPIETVQADMRDFRPARRADFAFVLFGSVYRASAADFLRHLRCMAASLKRGALYVMHMMIEGDPGTIEGRWSGYRARRGDVTVRLAYERRIVDAARRLRREILCLRVRDGRRRLTLVESNLDRWFGPEEFRGLLAESEFQWVAAYDGFRIDRPWDGRSRVKRAVCVVRRK